MSEDNAAAGATPSDPPEQEFQHFHPLTPLITGWKTVAIIFAIVTFNGLEGLLEAFESGFFTLQNVGYGAIGAAVAILFSIGVGALMWRVTTYAITDAGVFVRTSFIDTNRRVAPRERIESVSVERPFLARFFGLAKVRVELAGAGDSHIDLEYVSKAKSDEIYGHVLELARNDVGTDRGGESGYGEEPTAGDASSAESMDHEGQPTSALRSLEDRARAIAFDGDGDGVELARIPTTRLLHAMVRDIELWIMLALTFVVGIPWIVWTIIDGFSLTMSSLIAVIPTLLIGPRWVFNRIESGWGFISRATDSGLRARRGLLNSRSDNLSAFRIQSALVRRPVLWRTLGWTEVRVKTAGMDTTEESSADQILPVGTATETEATLSQLMPPLGVLDDHPAMHSPRIQTDDALGGARDNELVQAYLSRTVDELAGARPIKHWTMPFAGRFTIVALTHDAVLIRDGILARKVHVVPRERIQNVEVSRGPYERRLGLASVSIQPGGDDFRVEGLPETDAMALFTSLSRDAGIHRRYSNRESWAAPRLGRLHELEESPVA